MTTQLSKRERVDAALHGAPVDRVPVAAWQHFLAEENDPEQLANRSLAYFKAFDWDWLKVNPRATYYAEAWGNQYDFTRYDSVLPALIDGPLHTPADLEKIGVIDATGGVFAEHLDLVRRIRAGIGDAHFVQTVFSPLSVLSFLVARPAVHNYAAWSESQYSGIRQYLRENPAGAHEALRNIAETLGNYAAAAIDAGASGIFFAIVKLARQGILTEAEFEAFGKPYDLQVLRAIQGAPFNLLHICGPATFFDSVLDYPVHALNWATLNQQNPTLTEARLLTDKALIGGVDELGALQTGTPDSVIRQAQDAIHVTGGRAFLLTPGCGTNMDVPDANLHALRRAVE